MIYAAVHSPSLTHLSQMITAVYFGVFDFYRDGHVSYAVCCHVFRVAFHCYSPKSLAAGSKVNLRTCVVRLSLREEEHMTLIDTPNLRLF